MKEKIELYLEAFNNKFCDYGQYPENSDVIEAIKHGYFLAIEELRRLTFGHSTRADDLEERWDEEMGK